jgi:hypothetical protein
VRAKEVDDHEERYVIQAPDPSLPDMGVLSFEHVKTYE